MVPVLPTLSATVPTESGAFAVVVVGGTIILFATGLLIIRYQALPVWLGWVAVVSAVLDLPSGATLPAGWKVIGRVRAGHGVLVDGTARKGQSGWDHFR